MASQATAKPISKYVYQGNPLAAPVAVKLSPYFSAAANMV
jgi:hypothetical protein